MNDRLSPTQIASLVAYAGGMAGGQILFKAAALRFTPDGAFGKRIIDLFQNGFFLVAVSLYAVLAVLWVWILSFTPLSRAYPFVAIAFALTPLLAAVTFAEPLSLRLIIGIVVILGGLFLVLG
jgi:drug/metabolite transporter (DMT)-like permease